MAFVHGKDAVFKINNGSLRDLTAFTDNIEMTDSTEMGETTVMSLEDKTFISGLSEATFSCSGKYDSTVTTGPDDVLFSLKGDDTARAFELGFEGGTAGKVKYSGSCFMTQYVRTAPVGDVVTWTADFQITGVVTRGTFS